MIYLSMERIIRKIVSCITRVLFYPINHQLKELMAAIANLTQATVDLTAAVDAAVAAITTPHISEAEVQAAADAVNAQTARLNEATTTPVV